MKRFLAGILGVVVLGGILIGINLKEQREFLVVATNFPAYDFTRAVVGADDVTMLIPAGAEVHGFEPTPEDIAQITRAKLFVYNGGESEEWVEKILESAGDIRSLRMMDLVETVEEETTEGMEAEEDSKIDEHVWTSPKNAMKIVDGVYEEMSKISPEKTAEYQERADEYIRKLEKVDEKIRETVMNGSRRKIVFGDRFSLRYFTNEYGLEYFAAFPGCAEETEVSAKTLKFLVDKVREDKIPVVFRLELSSGKVAEMIAEETGAKVLEFNSAHNISKTDFENGRTYIEIMEDNIKVLSEALK